MCQSRSTSPTDSKSNEEIQQMQNIYQPYTYLIGWSQHNKWYYGVRYAKNCHPSDLWVTYFTSSKIVKKQVKEYGAPDIIQIRKTFSEAKQAVYYEQKVLRLLNVEKNKKFLNAKNSTTNTIITSPNKSSFKGGCTPWNKGKKSTLSAEERKKRYGRKFSKETKKYLSEKNQPMCCRPDQAEQPSSLF